MLIVIVELDAVLHSKRKHCGLEGNDAVTCSLGRRSSCSAWCSTSLVGCTCDRPAERGWVGGRATPCGGYRGAETREVGSPSQSPRLGSPSSRKGWPLACTSLKQDKCNINWHKMFSFLKRNTKTEFYQTCNCFPLCMHMAIFCTYPTALIQRTYVTRQSHISNYFLRLWPRSPSGSTGTWERTVPHICHGQAMIDLIPIQTEWVPLKLPNSFTKKQVMYHSTKSWVQCFKKI